VDPELRALLLYYAYRALWALAVAIAAVLLARLVRRGMVRMLERRRAHSNAVVLLGNLGQVLILTIGALVILAIFTGPNFGAILTSFSILGLVVGLSLQDILKNFFAGVWILVERPFRIGDTIQVQQYTGVVDQIAFRTTMLRTTDGRQVVLPNNTLMTEPVVNHSAYPLRRAELHVSVPEADGPEDVTGTVRAALTSVSAMSQDPAPRLELRRVSDGRLHYVVSFWAPEPETALPEAVAALRARLPKVEVQGA
jgi:small-conductance mechanosensitive channel